MSLLVPLLPHETMTVSARHLAHFKINSVSFWDATKACKRGVAQVKMQLRGLTASWNRIQLTAAEKTDTTSSSEVPLLNFIFKK